MEAAPPPPLHAPVINGMTYRSQIVCPMDGNRYYRHRDQCQKECRKCFPEPEDLTGAKPALLEERGFFQFSKPVRTKKVLLKWVDHFKAKGIETVIR